MADIAKARVPVVFDKAAIAKDADDAITPAIAGAATNAAKLVAGLAVTKGIANFGKQGLDEYIESQKVAVQTTVELRNISGITQQDVDDLGQSMLDLAGFDDEAARSAANVLLRFGAIADARTLKRVENDAADLAITMGTDLPSAAQTLGQILQDPENAARKLRPVIGALTDEQKASVKAFTDVNDIAGAQNVILGILEDRIGGTAKAYGDTLGGATDKAKESFNNAKAALVEGLAPALEVASDLASQAAQGIEELPGPLRTIASLAVGAGVAIVGIANPISGLVASFASLKAARLTAAGAATVDTEATLAEAGAHDVLAVNSAAATASLYAMSAAEEAEAAASAATLGPLAAVAAALAVGAALWYGYQNAESVNIDVDKANKASTAELVTGMEHLKSLLGDGGVKTALEKMASSAEAGIGTVQRMRDAVAAAGGDTTVYDQALGEAKTSQENLTASTQAGQAALGDTSGTDAQKEAVKQWEQELKNLQDQATSTQKTYEDTLTAYNRLLPAELRAQAGPNQIANAQQRIADAAQKLAEAQAGTAADTQKQADATLVIQKAQADLAEAQKKGDQLGAASAQNRIDKAQADLAGAAGQGADPAKVAAAQRDYEDALRSAESAANDYAQAQADLQVTQDAAAGKIDNDADKAFIYRNALGDVADSLNGPVHDALMAHIADLDAAAEHTQLLAAISYHDALEAAAAAGDEQSRRILNQLGGQTQRDSGDYVKPTHALGGYAPAGQAFRHGEQGDFELAVLGDGVSRLSQDAFVLDHQHSLAMTGGNGGVTVHQSNVMQGLPPEQALDLANAKLGWLLAGTAA